MKHLHIHINNNMREIEMKLSDLLTQNESMAGQLSKVETEVLGALAEMKATVAQLTVDLADAPLTDAQAQSVANVQAGIDKLDALVPDAQV
jgi:hypothetical protein